jgi:hypothetical protein
MVLAAKLYPLIGVMLLVNKISTIIGIKIPMISNRVDWALRARSLKEKSIISSEPRITTAL